MQLEFQINRLIKGLNLGYNNYFSLQNFDKKTLFLMILFYVRDSFVDRSFALQARDGIIAE